jgi:hypothetical protein
MTLARSGPSVLNVMQCVNTYRNHDYLPAGKDNYAADRAAGKESLRANLSGRVSCIENRAFLQRAVHYLATEADNDPIVLAHAGALLTSSPEGKTAYVGADLRDTGTSTRGRGTVWLRFTPRTASSRRCVRGRRSSVSSSSST